MQLEMKNKTNILAYLKAYTPYTSSYLCSLSDQQLYVIFRRTEQLKYNLVLEILDLQKGVFSDTIYKKEKLEKLNIETLTSIKNDLSQKAKESILSTPLSQDILTDSEPEDDYEYLTLEEIGKMYGEEAPYLSNNELQRKGIYLETIQGEDTKDLKELLITFLLRAHQKGLIYFPLKKATLETYSIEVLKNFYASKIKNIPESEDIPTLEEISRLTMQRF